MLEWEEIGMVRSMHITLNGERRVEVHITLNGERRVEVHITIDG